jgi:hypothetical protein
MSFCQLKSRIRSNEIDAIPRDAERRQKTPPEKNPAAQFQIEQFD